MECCVIVVVFILIAIGDGLGKMFPPSSGRSTKSNF